MVRLVDVIFPRPIPRAFTYAIPTGWHPEPEPGDRVEATLAGHREVGVIVDTRTAASLPDGVIPLLRPVDVGWRIPKDVLTLTRWVSEYYLCTWGEALAAAAPRLGESAGTQPRYRLSPAVFGDVHRHTRRLSGKEREILRILSAQRGTSLQAMARRLGVRAGHLSRAMGALAQRGIVTVSWQTPAAPIPPYAVVHGPAPGTEERLPREVRDFFRDIGDVGAGVEVATLTRDFPGGRAALRVLLLEGLLAWSPIVARHGLSDPDQPPLPEPRFDALDSQQQEAVRRLDTLIGARRYAAILLWGPTGSGKTAIYVEAIRRTWAAGRQALFLVPEIGLAGQMIARLEASLDEPIALWHSALSASERYWMARLIAGGRYRLVIGARSAVFAPLSDPGLIVVDEEQADAYKQSDPAPRYHARDVAVMRARLHDAVCLLGSATPSCESYHNAERGKYRLLRLTQRVQGRPLPVVHLVDLRHRGALEDDAWVTPELRKALVSTLRSGRKAIVFINRRGHSTTVACRHCGHTEVCPDCGLTFTYHAADRTYRCHFCVRAVRAQDACRECGGTDFLFRGVGTQKIEAALNGVDPIVRLARLDADIAAEPGRAAEILRGFAGDRYNLLVGTQMVAKGLDVADVGVVGVIWADQQMAFPDFRSEERTFQLVTQVAGRAGRGATPSGKGGATVSGTVVVQTFHPEHALIELAASQNTALFFERELPRRRQLHYPPFVRLVMVTATAPELAQARAAGTALAAFWRRLPGERRRAAGRLLGPITAAIPRRGDRFRAHLLIKTTSVRRTNEALGEFTNTMGTRLRRTHTTLTVDVDPVDFL